MLGRDSDAKTSRKTARITLKITDEFPTSTLESEVVCTQFPVHRMHNSLSSKSLAFCGREARSHCLTGRSWAPLHYWSLLIINYVLWQMPFECRPFFVLRNAEFPAPSFLHCRFVDISRDLRHYRQPHTQRPLLRRHFDETRKCSWRRKRQMDVYLFPLPKLRLQLDHAHW